jgi:hypothetical protein
LPHNGHQITAFEDKVKIKKERKKKIQNKPQKKHSSSSSSRPPKKVLQKKDFPKKNFQKKNHQESTDRTKPQNLWPVTHHADNDLPVTRDAPVA